MQGASFAVDDLGEEAADLGELGEELEFVEEADGGGGVEEDADAVGDGVEGVDVEGELHAALGAELVHEDAGAGVAGDVLEEEGGAAGLGRAVAAGAWRCGRRSRPFRGRGRRARLMRRSSPALSRRVIHSRRSV